MKENLQTKFDNFESSHDFSGTEWTGLEARLNKRDFWRHAVLGLLAGLFLLGLIGSNVALWRQNNVLSQRLSTIDVPKLMMDKAVKTTVLEQTDTLIKRTIIYQYDTIYRKITVVEQPFLTAPVSQTSVRESNFFTTETTAKTAQTQSDLSIKITANSTKVPSTNLGNNHAEQSSIRAPKASVNDNETLNNLSEEKNGTPQYKSEKVDEIVKNSRGNEEKQTVLTAFDSLNNEKINATNPAFAVADTTASASLVEVKKPFTKDSITMKKFPFDSLDIVKKDDNTDTKTDEKTAKKHPKYAFKMLPIYVGPVLGLPIWSKPTIVGQNGNQYGLKVEAVATERVRFFAEVNYTQNVETKSLDISMLPNEIMPPTIEPGLTFKYWETYGVKSFNYLLGVQYQLGKNEKFHPYVAAAFNATSTQPFDVDFEYINRVTNAEKKYVQHVSQLGHLNRVYGAIGVHWAAFTNGQLAAETYFTTAVDGDKALTPTQIGFKIGAFYFIR
jgi:hypothetical protein